MLKKQLVQYIETQLAEAKNSQSSKPIQIELFEEEKNYIEKHSLSFEHVTFLDKDSHLRFMDDLYIERCDKESEELLSEESPDFFNESISYFQKRLEEFIYVESPFFDIIRVDAISFEADSVFRTYDVMLGLKLPKKYETLVKSFLLDQLNGQETAFDLIFDGNEGLWNLNFTLNELENFSEEWTIRDAYQAIYQFLFTLVENVEKMANKE